MNIMDILKKPLVIAVIGLVVGLLLGFGMGTNYAYNVNPTKWIEQPMTWTRKDLKDDYLRMSIDSFRVNKNGDLAGYRFNELGIEGPTILETIKADPQGIPDKTLKDFENAVQNYVPPVVETPANTDSGGGAINPILAGVIILVALILIGLVIYFIVIPLFRSNKRAPEDMTPAMLAAEHSRTMEKTDYSTVSSTPPVAQYVTTYVLGDDLFDDSFSIDAPSGEFLGECGVGISETVGVGDPKKVTAFEVWMFDKNDIQTITKVLMSSNAFADLALRAKLEPKGELVQVEPRKQVLLETQTLQMIATISDMQYGQSALPNGSYFDRVTIELAIWQKAK